MSRAARGLWAAVGAAVLAMGLYAGTARGPLIWDDHRVFKTWLPHVTDIRSLFFPGRFTSELRGAYAHPIVSLSFRLDDALARSLWPPDRIDEARLLVCHASNILFYGLVTALVLVLGMLLAGSAERRTGSRLLGASLGALLFAVHPLHVESVAWISGRTDVLCALFWLGAVILYLVHLRSGRGLPFLLSLVAAFLAMLSKEAGVGLVLLLPLADLLFGRRRTRAITGLILRWAALAAIAALFFGWRQRAFQGLGSSDLDTVRFHAGDIAILLRALGWYVAKLFRPWPQSIFVPEVPGGAYGLLGAGSLLLAFATAIGLAVRRRVRRFGVDLFLGAFFLISLAPSLAVAIFPVSEAPLAERYLFIPSAGLCLLAGLWLARMKERLPRAWPAPARAWAPGLVAMAIAVPASVDTVERTKVWGDEVAFWSAAERRAPGAALPHLNLGEAYWKRGETDRALAHLRRALETYGDREGRAKALNNLGVLYARSGRCEEAARAFEAALREVPDYGEAYTNWAICDLIQASRTASAEKRQAAILRAMDRLGRALAIDPKDVKALFQSGKILAATGRPREGAARLREVIRLSPGSEEAAFSRRILAQIGRADDPGDP